MKPKLIIPLRWKNILSHLVLKEKEWHAFAKVTSQRDTNGIVSYVMEDIYFPKQKNSSSNTEDIGGTADMAYELKQKGENLGDWKLHIHSHHTMGAFWSATDKAQHNDWKSKDFMLGMVMSSTSEWKAIMNLFSPVRIDIDMEIVIDDIVTPQEELDNYKKMLEEKETFETDVFSSNSIEKYNFTYNNNLAENSFTKKEKKKYNRLVKSGMPSLEAIYEVKGFSNNLNDDTVFVPSDYNPKRNLPNNFTEEDVSDYETLIEYGYSHDEAVRLTLQSKNN